MSKTRNASKPSKSGFPQANRIAFTKFCRGNNSSGYNFRRDFRLTGLVKLLARSLESFTHRRNGLRFERSRLDESTDWHGRAPAAYPRSFLIP
jgi:hypothetical protein